MKQYRNYIFDLGGVIAELGTREALSIFPTLGMHTATDYIIPLDLGDMTGDEFVDRIWQGCKPGTSRQQVLSAYNDYLRVPRQRLELLQRLRQSGKRVYALSNIGDMHWQLFCEKVEEHGFRIDDCFDHCFVSYQMHMVKPNLDIFQTMIAEAGIDPHESIYFDDVETNIEGGKAAGLDTCLVPESHLEDVIYSYIEL